MAHMREKTRKILIAVLALVFVGSLVRLGVYYVNDSREAGVESAVSELVAKATPAPAQTAAPEDAPEESAPPRLLEKYAAVYEANPDTVGWLRIEGSSIDNVVMQTPEEPDKYLHLDFYGKQSNRGTLYMNGSCSIDTDDNLLIYGHRMKSGAMFGELDRYQKEDYWQSHKYIQFDTLYEEGTYEVVGAFFARILRSDAEGFRYYQYLGPHTEAQFNEYRDFIAANRCYDTGIDIAYGDRLLTLSTCTKDSGTNRFVVVARRLETGTEETLTDDAPPFAAQPEDAGAAATPPEDVTASAVTLSEDETPLAAAPVHSGRGASADLTLLGFALVCLGTAALWRRQSRRREK